MRDFDRVSTARIKSGPAIGVANSLLAAPVAQPERCCDCRAYRQPYEEADARLAKDDPADRARDDRQRKDRPARAAILL